MLDWLQEKRLPKLTGIEWLIIFLITFIVLTVIFYSSAAEENRQRLIQQCMDDGNKEYECEALLKRPPQPTTIVVPSY